MTAPRRANRGRAAAAANRSALIAAAREVFAEHGVEAPLSAVVRRAGVGQGSLYRHFPDRSTLALAALEESLREIEALAADPDAPLDDVLDRLTDQAIESVAFVDLVNAGAGDSRVPAVTQRLRQALAGPLDRAREHGRVRPSLDLDELMLAVSMTAVVVARTDPGQRRDTASDCWRLLDRALR